MLNRIERILVACNRWLLILLLVAMACIVFANVVLRYTTGDSIVWAEDMEKGIFIPAGQLPRQEPRKAALSASTAV